MGVMTMTAAMRRETKTAVYGQRVGGREQKHARSEENRADPGNSDGFSGFQLGEFMGKADIIERLVEASGSAYVLNPRETVMAENTCRRLIPTQH